VATIIANSNATVWSAIPPQSPQEALMLGAFGASDDDISSRFLLLEEIRRFLNRRAKPPRTGQEVKNGHEFFNTPFSHQNGVFI